MDRWDKKWDLWVSGRRLTLGRLECNLKAHRQAWNCGRRATKEGKQSGWGLMNLTVTDWGVKEELPRDKKLWRSRRKMLEA